MEWHKVPIVNSKSVGVERFAFEIDDEAWHCYETRSSC